MDTVIIVVLIVAFIFIGAFVFVTSCRQVADREWRQYKKERERARARRLALYDENDKIMHAEWARMEAVFAARGGKR